MKAIVCEMCDSRDFVKRDGLFVCQCCGTKYTVEEARKLMTEGVVEVRGTVTIDRSGELEKLYKAARNARETSDATSALRHYQEISALDPDSWEVQFYLVLLKTNTIKNGEIESAANRISNCLPKVFQLINEHLETEDEKKEAVWEVLQECLETAQWLTRVSHEFYNSLTKGNGIMALTGIFGAISSAESFLTELNEDNERCVAIANIMFHCADGIEDNFDTEEEDYATMALWCWKQMMDFHDDYSQVHKTQVLFDEPSVRMITEKINQYAPAALDSQDEEALVVLTVDFDSNAGGAGQLWYTIDYGERNTLNRKEQRPHFLERGTHVLSIQNPFMKKEHTFELTGAKTISIYGKSFGMDIK